MRRCSLLLLVTSACLVQDPEWEPPADTDAPVSSTTTGDAGSTSAVVTSTTDGTASGSDSGDETSGVTPEPEVPEGCEPLGDLPADAIIIGPADNATLDTVLEDAAAGSTVALEPGTYDRAGQPILFIETAGITLRSTTGNPEDVVLDGGGEGSRLISVNADNVTLAEFTVQNGNTNLVEIGGAEDTVLASPVVYRMRFLDAPDAFLDIGAENRGWTDDGSVACSTFLMTPEFREATSNCSGLGAIRLSGGANWVIRDNTIEGFWCATGAYASLTADLGSRDTRVVRNLLRNNHRGILLGGDDDGQGRPEPAGDECGTPDGTTWGHVRGEVINNIIWVDDPAIPTLDSMMGFWHVCAATAAHNTSYVTLPTFNGIEWRYADTSVTISNNLISTTLQQRNDAVALGVDTNISGATATEYVDAAAGDLRLVEGSVARDAGLTVPGTPVPRDYDGQPRVGRPDVGAFEFQP
jgi:hypothetical protein